MYKLLYEKRVFKDLDKIPNQDLKRILPIFKSLQQSPISPKTKKLSGAKGLYRIRQGNYRVIYTVDHTAKEVCIILVRHRKESYR